MHMSLEMVLTHTKNISCRSKVIPKKKVSKKLKNLRLFFYDMDLISFYWEIIHWI